MFHRHLPHKQPHQEQILFQGRQIWPPQGMQKHFSIADDAKGKGPCKSSTATYESKRTFVDNELAPGATELAQVKHGDMVIHMHGVLEGARVLDGCPAAQQHMLVSCMQILLAVSHPCFIHFGHSPYTVTGLSWVILSQPQHVLSRVTNRPPLRGKYLTSSS